jgi:hypothetical protein
MGNAVIRFGNSANALPKFAALGNEVVIWIDHEKCSDLFVVFPLRLGHVLVRSWCSFLKNLSAAHIL